MSPSTGHLVQLALLTAIAGCGLRFAIAWWLSLHSRPRITASGTGFVTIFFDTLGIGCFATTTTLLRLQRLVSDELIPGTLNVGHTIAAVASAFIFVGIVPVAPETLGLMICAAGLGAWLGGGVVARLPRHKIQAGMGLALLAAATALLMTQLAWLPSGGDALGLTGPRLALAVAANFVFGGLMTLGIGLYAPCMIMISLLGMNPRAAFPIMMGSCAFLMTISGVRFVRERKYDPSAAMGLTLGGLPALFIAAYVVTSVPLGVIRWGVIGAVVYTASSLLLAARHEVGRLRASAAPIPEESVGIGCRPVSSKRQ
jgi:uncharacterized membrane protein YfcA